MTDPIRSFLNPSKYGEEEEDIQITPEKPDIIETKPQTEEPPIIELAAPTQETVPTDKPDDIRSFLTGESTREKLSREMTHEPTIKRTSYNIRPQIVMEGIKKGFADFAALPGYAVDLVNYPLHKLGVTKKDAIGGSKQIREGVEAVTGYSKITPDNAAEEYAAKAAEFVGSGLLISGKLGAEAATQAAARGESALQAGMGTFGTDVASSVAAGVGAETTGSIFEQGLGQSFRGTGELLGGMSMGMIPYYIKNLAGGAANIKRAAKDPNIQEGVMENAAKQQIINAMGKSPYAEMNLQRAIELQQKIKNFNPNLAAATDSPGLKAFQDSLDSKSVENINRSTESIENSMNAIKTYYRSKFPVMDNEIVSMMQGKYQKGRAKLQTGIGKQEKQLERLERDWQRQQGPKIGEKLIELKGRRLKDIQAQKTAKYNELYKSAKDLDINVHVDDVRLLVDDIKQADGNAFQNMPNVYNKVTNLFKAKEPGVIVDAAGKPAPKTEATYASFEKVHSLYREVSKEYGKALRSGDSAKEYYLNSLRGVLDQKLKAFDDPVFGNFSNHKKATDQWWLNEYYNVFKQGLGSNIDYKTIRGDMTAPEKIINKLVLGKGTKGLEQFNKLYEGLPEAQTLLRDGIIDSVAKDIATKGFTQKTLDSFTNKHKEVLDGIPDLRNALSDTGAAVSVIASRRNAAIEASKKFIDARNSKHARLAGFEDIQEALHVGFKDKKILHTLMSSAGTKAEKQDLATGLGDYILANKDPWSFISKNEKTIKPIMNQLGEGHFKNVKDVAESMSIMGRYKLPSMPARSSTVKDPIKEATGTSLTSAFAQFRWAFFYGKTSAIYPFVDIGSKYLFKLNQGAVERLIEKSIYDPDLAKTLSTLTKRKKVPLKIWSDLSKAALNNGIKASAVALDATPRDSQRPEAGYIAEPPPQETPPGQNNKE